MRYHNHPNSDWLISHRPKRQTEKLPMPFYMSTSAVYTSVHIIGEAKNEMLKNFASDFEKNGYLSPKWPKYESQVVVHTTLYFKNIAWVALKI